MRVARLPDEPARPATMIALDRRIASALVAVMLFLTACARAPQADRADGSASPGSVSATQEAAYGCSTAGAPAYPQSVWSAQRPANGVDHPGREAVQREIHQDDLRGWFLLEASDERLAVARERTDRPDPNLVDPSTHDVVSVEQVGDRGWRVVPDRCAPRRVLDGLGPARVWLDGPPDPTSASVDLLVLELGCAGGQDARGRTRAVAVAEDDDTVQLVIGVQPLGPGEQECPTHPLTPMTVALAAPVGDRIFLDAAVWPPAPLEPYAGQLPWQPFP